MHDEFEDAPKSQGRQYVRFYEKSKRDEAETEKEGRPIFKMVEYVEIIIPGSRDVIDRPVRPADKERHATQYAAFKAGKSQDEAAGTPLALSGVVRPERVEELAAMRVKTVEQLADVTDEGMQKLGPGTRKERQRAQDYLAAMKGNAPIAQLRAESEKKDARIAALESQMAAFLEKHSADATKSKASK